MIASLFGLRNTIVNTNSARTSLVMDGHWAGIRNSGTRPQNRVINQRDGVHPETPGCIGADFMPTLRVRGWCAVTENGESDVFPDGNELSNGG
jgi:hypothetical protein